MHRLFLDANVLFSAAYLPYTGLLRLWNLKETVLRTSRYALEEARANLEQEAQHRRLIQLSENLQLFEAEKDRLPPGIFLPEKDVPILLAAFGAGASHLLTGDIRHFGPFLGKKIEGVAVMLPGEYLRTRHRGRQRKGP
jgi:predicted nucleic acid-binding protein